MNPGFLAGILGASVLSSLHCAGMCGPFVAFYSAGASSPRPHVVYHLQRALTYSTLGLVAGALGSGVDALGAGLGTLRVAALLASVLTVLWGVVALLPHLNLRRLLGRGRLFPSLLPGRLVQLKNRAPTTKAFVLGLSTPLLPCGTLYAFVTLAAGTGSAANGALTMFTFFVGTLPGLVGLGALTARLGSWLGARLPRLLGAALVIIGLFGVYERSQFLLSETAATDAQSCHGHH